jgi:hypothetical protein
MHDGAVAACGSHTCGPEELLCTRSNAHVVMRSRHGPSRLSARACCCVQAELMMTANTLQSTEGECRAQVSVLMYNVQKYEVPRVYFEVHCVSVNTQSTYSNIVATVVHVYVSHRVVYVTEDHELRVWL